MEIISGVHIPFISDIPTQTFISHDIKFSSTEELSISIELKKFLSKHIIEHVAHSKGEFISRIFPRPKRNGGTRIVLNLSKLNKFVVYEHFKMETLPTALSLIERNCFMTSVDLTDAYYSVPIALEDRKFLKFYWKNELFQFTCLPMGLACAPRVFTKLLKPLFSHLRSSGFMSVYYLDDSLLIADTKEKCEVNAGETIKLLTKAGFTINYKKSMLLPSKCIKFLGFIINSETMLIKLPEDKTKVIIDASIKLLKNVNLSIRNVASYIGLIVSTFPAVLYGPVYYRCLEKEKIIALSKVKGNFDAPMSLNEIALKEVRWWRDNVRDASKPIKLPMVTVTIYTDASLDGWGAVINGESTGGRWDSHENKLHINILELKAVFFALKSQCRHYTFEHIRIRSDSTTAVVYINNMGGTKSFGCNKIAKEIWEFAIERSLWISAEHLPGSKNVLADKASRIFHDDTEWVLLDSVFNQVEERLGTTVIDLFASRLNAKHKRYVSWKPDPNAEFVDAFTRLWINLQFYAFPPFSIISKCLTKVVQEKVTGTIIVPLWTTQPWFPKLMRLLISPPILLPLNSLSLPYSKRQHPLERTLRLLACPISGIVTESEDFRKTLSKLSCPRGVEIRRFSMDRIFADGIISVVDGTLIPCVVLKKKF